MGVCDDLERTQCPKPIPTSPTATATTHGHMELTGRRKGLCLADGSSWLVSAPTIPTPSRVTIATTANTNRARTEETKYEKDRPSPIALIAANHFHCGGFERSGEKRRRPTAPAKRPNKPVFAFSKPLVAARTDARIRDNDSCPFSPTDWSRSHRLRHSDQGRNRCGVAHQTLPVSEARVSCAPVVVALAVKALPVVDLLPAPGSRCGTVRLAGTYGCHRA